MKQIFKHFIFYYKQNLKVLPYFMNIQYIILLNHYY